MYTSVDEVCVAIDKLMLQNLELIEQKVVVTVQLEGLLRDGHIKLAKARYIQGKENIGVLQIPTEDVQMNSLFELETFIKDDKKEDEAIHFDICRKETGPNKKEPQDPIKWFGVLVPQNLRDAQKQFQSALYLAVQSANISAKMITIPEKLDHLKNIKNNFLKEEE
ncbi:coiled-coil domain-containing protein 115 [Cephus cinctus]|uniref:Vacuolar ATPase assembly protein VMA22 n=1 Tax=Cephus cinctus TaxID=211228 RepID=A0AAJ7BPW7_CEPCN|nr:coiled-coil domain-containing protein 115 [Cephus cinctus]XP_024939010.1 coiled-coil domain-containing protein 115 [Cephus cinctus]